MQFSTVLVALAATVVSTMAVPAPEPVAVAEPVAEVDLEKRANTVFVCSGENFTGQCVNYSPPYNTCQPWSALGLSGLGSWGPSQGTFCIWYNKPCGASDVTASDTFTFPGFSTVPGFWQFNTQSWKCWW